MSTTEAMAGDLPSPLEALAFMRRLADGDTLAAMQGISAQTLEVVYAAAYALYAQGKDAEAGRLFRLLVVQDHLDRRFHQGMAACLQRQAQYAEAAKYHGIASVLDLTDPEPVVHMAQCLLMLSRNDEAEHALSFAEGQMAGEARYAVLGERVLAMRQFLAGSARQGPPTTMMEISV